MSNILGAVTTLKSIYDTGGGVTPTDPDYGDAQIIGLRRPTATAGPGEWVRIDAYGNAFTGNAPAFFANHPVYADIKTVLIDGQHMTMVRRYYFRTATNAGGGIDYWISDKPAEGFELHPAFYSAGDVLSQFWVGAYHASNDPAASGTKFASLPDVTPQASMSGVTMIARMEARNGNGIAGFGAMTWHQICAIKMLCLIEVGTPDVRTVIGQGWNSVTAGAVQPTGTGDANWRGIYDLWGLLHQLTMGIEIVGARVWLADESGELVDTGHDVPGANYIGEMAGGDLAWAFLPAVNGSSTGGYLSYHWETLTSTTAVRHGGAFSTAAANVGLFTFHGSGSLAHSGAIYGARLAKV